MGSNPGRGIEVRSDFRKKPSNIIICYLKTLLAEPMFRLRRRRNTSPGLEPGPVPEERHPGQAAASPSRNQDVRIEVGRLEQKSGKL